MQRLQAEQLDQRDKLGSMRNQFTLPEGIYLTGHSLGAMPKDALKHVTRFMKNEYGKLGVNGWNEAGWIHLPKQLGNTIAPLIGAKSEEVIVTDCTSINLFKLIYAGLKLKPSKTTILIEDDIFPTDLYMAQSVASVSRFKEVVRCSRRDLPKKINKNTAIVIISHVNYRTSELHDLKKLAELAHQHGALLLADLSHSVGLMPIELNQDDVDFAVGCTYKFMNGGPGAPGFLYVAEKYLKAAMTPLMGWMGHQSPFEFSDRYVPANDIRKFLCGTPTILSMSTLRSSIRVLQQASLQDIKNKYQELGSYCIDLMQEYCPDMQLITPTNPEKRGGHIAFLHKHAYAISRALATKRVTIDYRAPNLIRFGLSPLYTRFIDVYAAVENLAEILSKKHYMKNEFCQIAAFVT